MDYPATLDNLLAGRSLDEEQAFTLFDTCFQGDLAPERLAAVLAAIRTRRVAADELVGFARAMRNHSIKVAAPDGVVLDNCGTGGASCKTFNISTAAAFVLAGAGITVAKHGNRSVTRPSGSADVLEAAGARLDLDAAGVERVLHKAGIAFLFAPTFHPAMRHAGPVRASLGVKTVFNLLGPLTNPASATHQVIGVYDRRLIEPMAEALARLGCQGGIVVHGDPGYDEATPAGLVHTVDVRGGKAEDLTTWDPTDLMDSVDPSDLRPVEKTLAPQVFLETLEGTGPPARLGTVALNVALGLQAAGRADNLPQALDEAADLVASGVGKAKWDAFVEATNE